MLEATQGKLTEGANEQAVKKTVKQLKANEYVNQVISPLSDEGVEPARGARHDRDHLALPHGRFG